MRLKDRTLRILAEMICGAAGGGSFVQKNFVYRTEGKLQRFFDDCEITPVERTTLTRYSWTLATLEKINTTDDPATNSPSPLVAKVLCELIESEQFDELNMSRESALADLNKALSRDGLKVVLTDKYKAHVEFVSSGDPIAAEPQRLQWSQAEIKKRNLLTTYLDKCSEDDFIEYILVPLFSQLGFMRITVTGHKDKRLEFGKDLWMKYRLPTGHVLYFGLQAKRGRLDATGRSHDNVAEILNQVHMMLDHPVSDTDLNKKILLDHIIIACGGEITKQAREWLGQHLDKESRRHIIFMDRSEILDLCVRINLPIIDSSNLAGNEDIPF